MDSNYFVRLLTLVVGVSCSLASDNTSYDQTYGYEYVYIEDYCNNNTLEIFPVGYGGRSQYGRLWSTRRGYYNDPMDCQVKLETLPDYRITLRFAKLQTYEITYYDDCEKSDTVAITGDTDSHVLCGVRTPRDSFYSTSNWLIISFKTLDYRWYDNGGFSLYYTAYHQNDCDDDTEFECYYGDRCIPRELKCDVIDNCGDWSDEHCGLGTVAIISVSLVCAIVGLCLLATCAFCVSYKKSNSNLTAREYARRRFTSRPATTQNSARTSETHPEPPPPYTYTNGAFRNVTQEPNEDPTYEVISPPSYTDSMVIKVTEAVEPITTYDNAAPTSPTAPHQTAA